METIVIRPTAELLNQFMVNQTVELYEDRILQALSEVWAYEPRDNERCKANDAVKKLVDGWFELKLGEKYQPISPKIFELQREITIDLSRYTTKYNHSQLHKNLTFQIPAFCVSENKHWSHTHKFEERGIMPYSGHECEIKISSERRPMPPEIRGQAQAARAYAYQVYTEALSTHPLSEIIYHTPDIFSRPDTARLLTLWQPKPSDLKIDVKVRQIDKDPILVLDWGKPYLVTTWEEPDELPFDDILAKALGEGQVTIDDVVSS